MKKINRFIPLIAGLCLFGAGLGRAWAVKVECSGGVGKPSLEIYKFADKNAVLTVVTPAGKYHPGSVILDKAGKAPVTITGEDLDTLAVYNDEKQEVYNRWFFRKEGLIYYDAIMSIYPSPLPYSDPDVVRQIEGIAGALKAGAGDKFKRAHDLMRNLEDAQGALEREYGIVEPHGAGHAGKAVRSQSERAAELRKELGALKSQEASAEEIKNLVNRIEQELNAATRMEEEFSNMR